MLLALLLVNLLFAVEARNKRRAPKPTPDPTNAPTSTVLHYGEWSECSKSCGMGTQTRRRCCLSQDGCDDVPLVEAQVCNFQECPVACGERGIVAGDKWTM